MFRLGRMTDYGVVVMTHLACAPGRVMTAPDVATAVGLPAPAVAKLLKTLGRGGLVTSHRGAGGGYAATASRRDIAVSRVIEAIEGPVALAACVEGSDGDCTAAAGCPMRGRWDPVNTAIRAALDAVSLADMASPIERAFFAEPKLPETASPESDAPARAAAPT